MIVNKLMKYMSLSQWSAALRYRIESIFNWLYSDRHPCQFEFICLRALGPMLKYLTPNDRWSLPVHIPIWTSGLESRMLSRQKNAKRIYLLTHYRGQYTHNILLAIFLALRGHAVTIFYIPKLRSPVKNPLEDSPGVVHYIGWSMALLTDATKGAIQVTPIEITSNVTPNSNMFDQVRAQVISDLVMQQKAEVFDLEDPKIRTYYEYYLKLASDSRACAETLLTELKEEIDLLLVPNGSTFEGAQFCAVARKIGVSVNTFEKFAFRKVRFLNHGGEFCGFDDLNYIWTNRLNLGYLKADFIDHATEYAHALMSERRNASLNNWSWVLQNVVQTKNESLAAAFLSTEDQYILVCPNVPFDAGYSGLTSLFPSMEEWLRNTVSFLLERSKIKIVVRAHPGEASHYGGEKKTEDILHQWVSNRQLLVINADAKINTYGLMECCSFGVVFSSTTGIEMAMLGKDVVVGSNVYYGQKGFTIDSFNLDEYFGNLLSLLKDHNGIKRENTKSKRESAALFHYILHNVMQFPYPYDKPGDERNLLPCEVVNSCEWAMYSEFLDLLALNKEEWQSRVPSYYTARRGGRFDK